jgi:hypothetical protein
MSMAEGIVGYKVPYLRPEGKMPLSPDSEWILWHESRDNRVC